jgi:anhydro-N-acetylmuramic acid kinase
MTGPRALAALSERDSLTAIGLLSGTSADGIDAAVVRVRRRVTDVAAELLGGGTSPFDEPLRERVLAAGGARADEIARLHALLGARFGEAAVEAVAAAGLRAEEIDVIGSHGQTVAHLPGAGGGGARAGAATLQIGCPARIVERTGRPVVSDLRARDTAAGGEGAPLVPHVDWLLLRPAAGARLVQNLGGVGNVTLVTQDAGDVRAFDTGPGNGPLDAAARRLLGAPCDRDGAAAARGRVVADEVERGLAHPWFHTPPPRSLARETFGDDLVSGLIARRPGLAPEDVLATLTELVARSLVAAYRDHLGVSAHAPGDVLDVVVSGGGVHNVTLMRRLAALLDPMPVRSSADLGFDPDLREAVAFAVLACEAVWGRPSNVPAVTGASGSRVLGSFTLP